MKNLSIAERIVLTEDLWSNGPFKYNKTEISEIRFMTLDEILKKKKEGQLKLAKPVHLIIESLSLR